MQDINAIYQCKRPEHADFPQICLGLARSPPLVAQKFP